MTLNQEEGRRLQAAELRPRVGRCRAVPRRLLARLRGRPPGGDHPRPAGSGPAPRPEATLRLPPARRAQRCGGGRTFSRTH